MNDQRRNNQERKEPMRPTVNGRRPAPNPQNTSRPTPNGARPMQSGQRPIQNGQRPAQTRRPDPTRNPQKAPTPPPRRRNNESYVFSRSLSETQERILTERRERLEDARRFRREDVKDKMIKGLIAFGAIFIVLAIIATVVVSCALNAGSVKKSKGEFVYKVGTKSSELAYKDAVKNGTIYISMNSIAELCELTDRKSVV